MRLLMLVLAVVIALAVVAPASARRHHFPSPPAWAKRDLLCIHSYEGSWRDKRNPADRGGLQIAWATWRALGGRGDPADASIREQLWRGWLLRLRVGRWGSTAAWPNTAPMCGLY